MIVEALPSMIQLANEVDTTNDLVNLDALNAILAFVSATFIIPIIQRPSFSTKVRAAITFIYSVVLGLITTWAAGDLDVANVAQSIVTVFTVAIVTYHGFAQPTQIAPAIENATSPGSARKQPVDDPPA